MSDFFVTIKHTEYTEKENLSLAPMLLRGSVYLRFSMHSHAGAWERVAVESKA